MKLVRPLLLACSVALALSACSSGQQDDKSYTPPAGGGASAVSTAEVTPVQQKTQAAPTAAAPVTSSTLSAPPTSAAADEGEAHPAPDVNAQMVTGSMEWVAKAVTIGTNSMSYTDPYLGAQTVQVRRYVTDAYWTYLGGDKLGKATDYGSLSSWQRMRERQQTTKVTIDNAVQDGTAMAAGEHIVSVTFHTRTTDKDGTDSTSEVQGVSYVMKQEKGSWKVDRRLY